MKSKTSQYYKTKKGLVCRIYQGQKDGSKKRNHRPPEYTLKELREWLFSQELFYKLYNEWKQSGYKKDLSPSVDRKYDDIHYCMNNIQLMTWGKNNNKARESQKDGTLNTSKKHISVTQHNKQGDFIAEYISMSEAGRINNIPKVNISQVCSGKRKSASGYIWRIKDLLS